MWQIIIVLFISLLIYNFYWKRKNLPPGPTPLPLIGNLLTLKRLNIEQACFQWKKQYGDFYTIWFGESPLVIVGDAPTIFETFVKDGEAYAGRPFDPMMRQGIVMVDGSLWREQRRFALHVLRNFGLGRNLMQERVLYEVSTLIENVKMQIKNGGENVSVQEIIDICVGSIINSLAFGISFDKNNQEEFLTVKGLAQKAVKNSGDPVWRIIQKNQNLFKNLPFFSSVYKRVVNDRDYLLNVFIKKIETHKQKIDLDADQEPTDYVEAFLRHQHKLDQDGVKDHNYTNKQLVQALIELWIAGQETTSNTLAWMVLYMMEFPETQIKAQEELDKIIGSDRLITLEDKTSLNYINAIVAETQRYCNLVTLNIPHRLTKDVTIHGYHFPKGTLITHQVSSVMFDEKNFPNPQRFKPERFLDTNGKFFQPPELMPFGVGKRACLGEGLARLELFLFTANILNHFKLAHPSEKKADMTRIVEGPAQPNPFQTFVKNRF